MNNPILKINRISKQYDSGLKALEEVNLEISKGEIFALLGPNGAGKTTLISIICGITKATSGSVFIEDHDTVLDYRYTRSKIGLVPQELTTDAFESVWNAVSFSRGLFGKEKNPDYIEKILKDLSLWDKKDNRIMTLSGGMKRRVLIAKALSHEPEVLFLDEPTAGVDVELRRDMWQQISHLRSLGVTIILTTHYIEEAEEMSDRVGIISKGKIILVEETKSIMKKLGVKKLTIELKKPLKTIPDILQEENISVEGAHLHYTYDAHALTNGVSSIFEKLNQEKIEYHDVLTKQSSLEEIFMDLVKTK